MEWSVEEGADETKGRFGNSACSANIGITFSANTGNELEEIWGLLGVLQL
jgi:hypothetical protein